ncbi:MAG: ribonuclease PH, partial [Actinobacteria bacterium]|nr:ribonuclease PH [Actinomycetota bacterium]
MSNTDAGAGKRIDGRTPNQLREIKFERGWLNQAEGSV